MSSKGSTKLIAFVLAYTLVAFVVLVVIGVLAGSELAWPPTLFLSFFVALVTVVFDEKATVAARPRMVVRALIVPAALGWLYLCYQTLTSDFPEPGMIWYPLVCMVLFVGPTLLGKRRGKKRRG